MASRLLPILVMVMASISRAAVASTIPSLPTTDGSGTLQLGLIDVSFDRPVAHHLSVGVTAMFLGFDVAAAVRATGTVLTTQHDVALGWTTSLGASQTTGMGVRVPFDVPIPHETSIWLQPALNVELPFLFKTRLRGTLAPSIGYADSLVSPAGRYFWTAATPVGWVVLGVAPALELAIPVGDRHELTLGGNGLLGWRGKL